MDKKTNPFIFSVVTSITSFVIINIITSLTLKISILDALVIVVKFLFSLLKSILIFNIPVWILLIVGLIIFILYIMIKSSHKNIEPAFLSYKSDHIKDWFFKWNYYYNFMDKTYEISNLRPICQCSSELSANYDHIYCPVCHRTYPKYNTHTLDDIKKIISYKINNKCYPTT